MDIQRCKGARDLLPEDMERFRQIEDAFRNTCINWGYREIKTPTLEYMYLFTATGTLTPAMLSRVYSFLDWDGWGGERIVLRPDGTIPTARLYCENMSRQNIARLYYITNVFAFEETGTSDREKWQCGVELIGDDRPVADVEVISIALEAAASCGIQEIELKLSHAGVLKALIAEHKLNRETREALLDEILEGNWQALSLLKSKAKGQADIISTLINLKGKSSGFLANLQALPAISLNLKREISRFIDITSLLDALGYKYEIDFTSIKGFEYYTGLCFKIVVNGMSICSGGRYDNLLNLVGKVDRPACGFAFYIDQISRFVKPSARQKDWKTVIVRTRSRNEADIKTAFYIADALRTAGLIVEMDFGGSQLKARWFININKRKGAFTLTDSITKIRKTADKVDDIMSIIGRVGNGS